MQQCTVRFHKDNMPNIDSDPIKYVMIPVPMYAPHARGRAATHGQLSSCLKVSLSADDVQLIKQEARRLSITDSAFIRWCALYVARELHSGYENVAKPRVQP